MEMTMKISAKTVTTLALAGLVGGALSISPPLYAQDSAAGQEMHQSGASAKAVVSAPSVKAGAGDAADSVRHAYRGTKDQISDAALTTKVKAAMLTDHVTKKYTIHVDSNHGTVTLVGKVDSSAMAAHAQMVVANVSGVQMVKNDLTWPTSVR
jgi:hyperosmotically inducible protein